MLVLEELESARARGAKIYAEVIGYGQTSDAFHIAAQPEDGEGAARCMAMALRDAGLAPGQVDYINAHGTSTPLNDFCETRAIKTVFGEQAYKLAVSSTKSMTGHLLGAAGAIEAIAAIFAICTDTIPPTINFKSPDPEIDSRLNITPNSAQKRSVKAALSNTFGFGGHNASIIFQKI